MFLNITLKWLALYKRASTGGYIPFQTSTPPGHRPQWDLATLKSKFFSKYSAEYHTSVDNPAIGGTTAIRVSLTMGLELLIKYLDVGGWSSPDGGSLVKNCWVILITFYNCSYDLHSWFSNWLVRIFDPTPAHSLQRTVELEALHQAEQRWWNEEKKQMERRIEDYEWKLGTFTFYKQLNLTICMV